MFPFHRQTVRVNGIQINYYRSTPAGGGPPLVMLHGMTDSALAWGRVAGALSGAYDLILPDTRGHGFSERPAQGYREELADDIIGLVDALALDRPALIGHSLGGHFATFAAAALAEKVRAVVLEDPAWFADDGEPKGMEDAAAQWCGDLRENQRMDRESLIALCRKHNPGWHADDLGPWADSRLRMDENALRQILLNLRPGWRQALAKIQCPVLLVTGDPACKVIISPEMVKEVTAINPRVREANVPGAGHSIHREQFEGFIERVRAFLEEIN